MKTPSSTTPPPGVGSILKLGEEKLTQLLTQLLGNDVFVSALQSAIAGAIKAKGTVDRGMVKLLSSLNVPTLEDVAALRGKLEELEESIADLVEVVDALEQKSTVRKKSRKTRERNSNA